MKPYLVTVVMLLTPLFKLFCVYESNAYGTLYGRLATSGAVTEEVSGTWMVHLRGQSARKARTKEEGRFALVFLLFYERIDREDE